MAAQVPYYESTSLMFGLFHKKVAVGAVPRTDQIVTPQTGRLVAPGDVNGLAAALVELLSSAELRERMGRAAIARSREIFSPQAHERRWTALIRDVAVRHAYGAAA